MTKNTGIPHIESLAPREFIDVVSNIDSFIATEKLDGSNLVFGFENDGTFYTSRESKGGQRFYSQNDFSDKPADVSFKSAHIALNLIAPEMKEVLNSGDCVECEVLYGRQPNAIVYGSNCVAFLRMLPGDNNQEPDQEKIKALGEHLQDVRIKTQTYFIQSSGTDNEIVSSPKQWKFATTSLIQSSLFKKVRVTRLLKSFEKWLSTNHDLGLTNEELLTVNLTSIPKDDRPAYKQARENVTQQATDNFKTPIKEKYLDGVLRKISPVLRDVDVLPYEDLGVEGVVLMHPDTLQQVKIVDKDVFTVINQFNHAIRNDIKKTTMGSYDFEATLGNDGDVFGMMLEQIAEAHGIKELAKYNAIKRTLRKMKGDTIEDTRQNVVDAFIDKEFDTLKTEILHAVDLGLDYLKIGLLDYNINWSSYRLTLNTGKTLQYTEEIHLRTLIVFAEVRKEMLQIRDNVTKSTSPTQIVQAIYEKQLNPIH